MSHLLHIWMEQSIITSVSPKTRNDGEEHRVGCPAPNACVLFVLSSGEEMAPLLFIRVAIIIIFMILY